MRMNHFEITLISFLVIATSYCVDDVSGSKILLITALGSKSHKNFFSGAAEVLAERGHEVTVVSMFDSKKVANVREVVLPGPDLDILLGDVFTSGPEVVIRNLLTKTPEMCSESLAYFQQTNVHKEKFDLVIYNMFLNYCYLSIVHELKVPFIYVSPAGLFGPFTEMGGGVSFPGITPNKLFQASLPLSFKDRLIGVLMDFFMSSYWNYYTQPRMEQICKERELCPADMPPFSQFHDNVSLVLLNQIQTLEVPPRPTMPHIVYAGGIHCKPGKPLPKDLEDFVESSGDAGFIFFSMGSAMRPSFLSEKYRKALIKAFGALDEKVLFKWDKETMDDLPPNVKLGSWLPQQDLLAHPKMKLFITHGGLHSTMEATYFGVPVIGIPIFADQVSNLKEAEMQGWAKMITWPEVDEDKLVKMIREVIQDDKMKENVRKRAAIMTDMRNPPRDDVAYWVEYVLRHKGADHIRSPIRKTPWYILYNVDVYVALISTTLLFLSAMTVTAYLVLSYCCCSKASSKPTKPKPESKPKPKSKPTATKSTNKKKTN